MRVSYIKFHQTYSTFFAYYPYCPSNLLQEFCPWNSCRVISFLIFCFWSW